uniref:rRNA N-glycosylase n=1 Tax=Aegilops tauschii subsp. strangulata TaxID=200361 RepID=A0A453JEN6_AEGTS
MAWAPSCSCTTGMMMATTFSRCAPPAMGARRTSPTTVHLRPSPASPTSWSKTAVGDRALVSTTTKRRTVPPACNNKPGPSGQAPTSKKDLSFDINLTAEDDDHFKKNFLEPMRDRLSDPEGPTVDILDPDSGNVVHIPRLPPQVRDNPAPELMNLTLHLGEEARVTLSVQTDNLYVVGFRNGEGKAFEFTHYNPDGTPREGYRMIPGSTNLGYSGSYAGGNGMGGLSQQQVRPATCVTRY